MTNRKAQLLLTLPGIIDAKQKVALGRKGLIVVETPNLDAVRLIEGGFLLTTDQWAIAALETLAEYSSYHEKFAARVLKNAKENRDKKS